jgi:hypothetical protein
MARHRVCARILAAHLDAGKHDTLAMDEHGNFQLSAKGFDIT